MPAPILPLPLKPLDLNLGQPRVSLVQESIKINGQPFYFFHPQNDDTIMGTLSCLQNDKFHLSQIPFEDDDVFIDIGCNVGLVGMVVAKMFPGVRVYSFDASKIAVECARAGAAVNGCINMQVFHLAVGAEDKKDIKFYSDGKNQSCLVAEGLNTSNPIYDSKVNQIAIDEIFDSRVLDIEKVKYFKIDIEGGEHPIFNRLFMSRTDILDRIEYLHLEVHDYKEFKPDELVTKVKEKWGNKVFFDV